MVLCIDVDNILNDLTEKTLTLYNSRSGKNIQMEDITTYNFYNCFSKEDADGIVALFKEKELWDSLKPLYGSQDGLKKLIKQGHKVYLATSTDPINFQWKCEWLQQYFPFVPLDNVIRVMDKSLLRCDVMLDDNLDNLTSNVCDRIALDYPWNRSTSKDYAYNINRVKDWNGVVQAINKIEKEFEKWEKR